MHGGTADRTHKGNGYGLRHGIYTRFYSPAEVATLDTLKLGDVDAELKLCRIRLARAMDAEQRAKDQPELVETVVRRGSADGGPTGEKRYRRNDYAAIIDRLLGRIESLEKTRLELIGASDDADGSTESVSVTIERRSARRDDAGAQ